MKARRGVALLVFLGGVIAACGGGGGGGGGGGPVTPPPSVTLTPSGTGVAPAVRLGQGAGTTATQLEVEVRADGVSDLYGVAFDLTYPATLLRFDAFAEGSFLTATGVSTSLQVSSAGAGTLVVGLSRLGAVSGIGGSGLLLTLRFTALAPGEGNFSFSRSQVFNSVGAVQTNVTFAAGSVRVVQ